jgi:hypothetical protein
VQQTTQIIVKKIMLLFEIFTVLLISKVNIITLGTATSFDHGGHPQVIPLLKSLKETVPLAGIF